MSERITPDEAIEEALRIGAQGISLGLAKTLQADRNRLRAELEAAIGKYHAEIKRGRIACEGIVAIVEKERDEARAEVGRVMNETENHYMASIERDRAEVQESSRLRKENAALRDLDSLRSRIRAVANGEVDKLKAENAAMREVVEAAKEVLTADCGKHCHCDSLVERSLSALSRLDAEKEK